MGKIAQHAKTVTGGFCMALADSVPGVSGSTVAFVMGFYDTFISSLHSLAGRNKTERKTAACFLAKLFSGWIAGMIGAVLFLSRSFQTRCYFFSSLFLGMTLASIPFIVLQEKETLRANYRNSLFIIAGAAVAAGMFFLRPLAAGAFGITGSLDFQNLAVPEYVYLFAGGILGIMAMLLPGISGSTLLLLLGIYIPAITALSEFLHGNFNVLPGIVTLGSGIVFGIIISVGFIHNLMVRNRNAMLYFIIGLVAGSAFAIVQGPATLKIPQPAMTLKTFSGAGFLIGAGVLALLELTRMLLVQKHPAD
jgi:putative membrane protein